VVEGKSKSRAKRVYLVKEKEKLEVGNRQLAGAGRRRGD